MNTTLTAAANRVLRVTYRTMGKAISVEVTSIEQLGSVLRLTGKETSLVVPANAFVGYVERDPEIRGEAHWYDWPTKAAENFGIAA